MNVYDKNTVEFQDNYDATMKEPCMLPVSFPTILLNANQGIAVGMASNICSFNLKELCEATIALIKKPNADISEILIAPDFPTGGYIIYNKEQLQEIYKKCNEIVARFVKWVCVTYAQKTAMQTEKIKIRHKKILLILIVKL